MTKERLNKIINALIRLRDSASDEIALENVDIYPEWKANVEYVLDKRVSDSGILYRCIQPHTSQDGWEPHLTPALWTRVFIEEWPEWIQPIGASDAYQTGDKVSHNEKHWVCDVNNNVWEPGVYGWSEVT